MSNNVLLAETGRVTGSAASRRLRAEDSIPAVLYGMGIDAISLSVKRRDLRAALSGHAGMNTVLDLSVDGTVYSALIKDLQRHPVRRTVSHVDFIKVDLDAEITVSVPVRLTGEASLEISGNNGLIDPAVDTIEVVTTPRSIPDEFVIDISEMTMDSVIHLSDVPMPTGVRPTHDPDLVVVTVLTMRGEIAEIEAADAEVAEAAAEGEAEAAAPEGGAAADEASDSDSGADASE